MPPEDRTCPLLLTAAVVLVTTLSCTERTRPNARPTEIFADQPVGSQPFVLAARLTNGETVGDLTLGVTTLKEAVKMFPVFPRGADEGQPRPDSLEIDVTGRILKPLTLYNPWHTMYQLHFDANERLVLIVDGKPELRYQPKNEVLARYPQLKESQREASWFEMQGELQPCVTLMAEFGLPEEKVNTVAYAFTCATK